MEIETIRATVRKEMGTKAARKLRAEGSIPVVIYGHGEPPESITMPQHEVEVALQHGARILKVELGSRSQAYLIKDVQYDHFDHEPLHLDLTRVDMDEKVQVKVGIEFRGTPKGVNEGGMLDHHMTEIEIECLPGAIPDTLHPIVVDMEIGDTLYVKDLDIPAEVKVLTDAEERVATVRAKAEEEAPEGEEGEEGEGEQQPEVISRGKKEDEGEAAGA